MPNLFLKNRSGKVLTALFVIIAILLVTLTAICLYLLQKEVEKRKDFETKLETSRLSEARLTSDLDETKKDKEKFEIKNRELDEKVNDLTGEVELEQGISKQLKSELASVKDQLDQETQKNQKLQGQLKRLADLEQENITFRSQFDDSKSVKEELENKVRQLEEKNQSLTDKIADLERTIQGYVQRGVQAVQNVIRSPAENSFTSSDRGTIGLDKIVIASQVPAAAQVQGRVLTVDTETHFVIVSLGSKVGLSSGNLLSVYRGDQYLGDIRVTQLQEEMAAADFIPPLSSRSVRRDDQVFIKK